MKDENEKLNNAPSDEADIGLDIPQELIIDDGQEAAPSEKSPEEKPAEDTPSEEAVNAAPADEEAPESVPGEAEALPAYAEIPESKPSKKLVNIFSELDDPDAVPDEEDMPKAEEEHKPAEEAVRPEPPEPVDEAERRRRMIEHRRNDALSAKEIAARKKAHADRQKNKNKKKKKGKAPAGKMPSGKNAAKNGAGRHPAENAKGRKHKTEASPKKTQPAGAEAEEKPVDMDEFRRARNKLKARKHYKRLIILLVIAALAAGIYFTKGLWVPKFKGILDKPHETIVNDSTEQSGNFPLDTGDSTVKQITRLDGSIITADASHITTYDTNGKLRESIYHGCGSPEVRSAGKRMLCFDFGGTGFKLYGKSGLMFEKQISGTVLLGNIAENGNVLIVSEDSKYTVTVNVYDKNGEDIYRWSDGDRVTDACFTADGSGLIVTTFGANSGKLTSCVHRIDMTQSNLVSESDRIDGFIIRTCETKDGCIWAMGEDRLWLLSQNCRSLDSYELTAPVSFDMDSGCVCAACDSLGGGTSTYVFEADNASLKPKIIENPEGKITKVRCFDGMAFVLSTVKLDAYSPDGSLVSTAAVSSDHSDFVYSENAAYFIDRHEVSKLIFKT